MGITRKIKSSHIHKVSKLRSIGNQPNIANIELAISGVSVSLKTNELFIAVKILSDKGMSTTKIATMLGCCCRTVTRHRARMRKFKES